jgi:predicted ester cyclase
LAEGWLQAAPDFTEYIDRFIVKGNVVVTMGRIRGTIKDEFFGLPATNKKFDCQYCQVAFVEKGKIKYARDYWNAADIYNQVGWDINALKH